MCVHPQGWRPELCQARSALRLGAGSHRTVREEERGSGGRMESGPKTPALREKGGGGAAPWRLSQGPTRWRRPGGNPSTCGGRRGWWLHFREPGSHVAPSPEACPGASPEPTRRRKRLCGRAAQRQREGRGKVTACSPARPRVPSAQAVAAQGEATTDTEHRSPGPCNLPSHRRPPSQGAAARGPGWQADGAQGKTSTWHGSCPAL